MRLRNVGEQFDRESAASTLISVLFRLLGLLIALRSASTTAVNGTNFVDACLYSPRGRVYNMNGRAREHGEARLGQQWQIRQSTFVRRFPDWVCALTT